MWKHQLLLNKNSQLTTKLKQVEGGREQVDLGINFGGDGAKKQIFNGNVEYEYDSYIGSPMMIDAGMWIN